MQGFDAAVLMEVIEHLEPGRLPALERAVFEVARPETVVVTTPNSEYDVCFETLPAGRMRHRDLDRLRQRSVSGKRSLASREFALGVEALERFAPGEPLRWVHECVFGVLALESEPIDPRL